MQLLTSYILTVKHSVDDLMTWDVLKETMADGDTGIGLI